MHWKITGGHFARLISMNQCTNLNIDLGEKRKNSNRLFYDYYPQKYLLV